jgi:hypothetical protein
MRVNRHKMKADREAVLALRPPPAARPMPRCGRTRARSRRRSSARAARAFAGLGGLLAARHHLLWVYCPAATPARDVDLRTFSRHRDAAITSLILGTVLPLVPASCAVRPARAPVQNQHRRRDADRAHAASPRRVGCLVSAGATTLGLLVTTCRPAGSASGPLLTANVVLSRRS